MNQDTQIFKKKFSSETALILKNSLELSDHACLVINSKGVIFLSNRIASVLFKIDQTELENRNFTNYLSESDKNSFFNFIAEQTVTESDLPKNLNKIRIKLDLKENKGNQYDTYISYFKIDNEKYFTLKIEDVKEKQKDLAEKIMLSHAIKHINECLAILDADGKIIFTNQAFNKTFKIEKNNVNGSSLSSLFNQSSKKIIDDNLRSKIIKEVWTKELEAIRSDGQEFPFLISASAIKSEQNKPLLITIVGNDISERKTLEAQLRQSQRMEAIGQLAGGIAHDFNNLLIVIGGYSNNLLTELDFDDPKRRKIEEIYKAADRAGSLTRQLLAFSRKQIMQPKIINLNVLISEMGKMLKRLIGENIDLFTVLYPKLDKIEADPGQIEQVIMNLVVNSRDAMPEGGKLTIETYNKELTLEESIKHKGSRPGLYVVLSISDTGIGMSSEMVDRIFEPFFTTKDQGKGTGLGLSTVYGIIKQSNCYIMVDSKLNQGTTFKILIPSKNDTGSQNDSEKKVEEASNNISGKETILVVEDENQVRELVCEMLELNGYNIIQAINGNDAIELYNNNAENISLILTDVVMPQMGGKKFIDSINIQPDTKVIYMSGYTDNSIDSQGILNPNTEFIQKPFTPVNLLKKVREVLDK